jgi:hypothetical protein
MSERTADVPAPIVVLTGLPGVGKSTFAMGAEHVPLDLPPQLARFSHIQSITFRNLLAWDGYRGHNVIEDLQAYHERRRAEGKAQQILEPLADLRDGTYIVDSLRHEEDIEYAKRHLGAFVIALIGPVSVCKQWFLEDSTDPKHTYLPEDYSLATHNEAERKALLRKAKERAWSAAMREVYDGEGSSGSILASQRLADVAIPVMHTHEQRRANPELPDIRPREAILRDGLTAIRQFIEVRYLPAPGEPPLESVADLHGAPAFDDPTDFHHAAPL